jgi:hypothetical protein
VVSFIYLFIYLFICHSSLWNYPIINLLTFPILRLLQHWCLAWCKTYSLGAIQNALDSLEFGVLNRWEVPPKRLVYSGPECCLQSCLVSATYILIMTGTHHRTWTNFLAVYICSLWEILKMVSARLFPTSNGTSAVESPPSYIKPI